MNKYEMMFIVKATMDAEQVKATAENVKKNAESKESKVVEYKELGEKKLAYPIKKELNGYYFVMQLEASKEAVAELDRICRINQNVVRHLIVNLEEK